MRTPWRGPGPLRDLFRGGAVARIVIISGNNQTGNPSSPLTDPFVVEVRDANGDPVVGVSVTATPSEGSIDSSPELTDAFGRADFVWTLGPTEGTQSITFSATGYRSATGYATAVAATVEVIYGGGHGYGFYIEVAA